MNIDFNTLSTIVLGGFTAYFAIAFFRSVLRERKQEMANRINEVEENFWREHEKIYSRINALERCCSKQEKCDKSYYNTGA